MADVLRLHDDVCPTSEDSNYFQLSADGVQETKSNRISLDVYSIKKKNCRQIYPLKIIRPINKFHVDYRPHLKRILDSFQETNSILDCFVGDNPKRSNLKECLCHSSNYACEYCVSKAQRYIEKCMQNSDDKNELEIKNLEMIIDTVQKSPVSTTQLAKKDKQLKLLVDMLAEMKKRKVSKKQSHPVWPHCTSNGPPRTQEQILSTLEMIDENGRSQLSADDVKGVVGRSLFLDIHYFNIVRDMPVEYMHVGCLGAVKRNGS